LLSERFDIAIVGAGVVGCAIARRLTLDGAKVIVFEKALDVLDGASKGNSAILHTGFDAPIGSLEQICVARGYAEYLEIANSLTLPILKSGAMVLAWNDEQAERLPELVKKAHKNGVLDSAMLSKEDILMREPHLSKSVVSGFEVPGEYIIDPWSSAHAYLLQAMANGAQLCRGTEVLGGLFDSGEWTLKTSKTPINATHVINCAGLYGDVVDERLINKKSFTITPRKGQFVVFDKSSSALTSSIILPVPTEKTKGVVICRTIFGNLLVGPTAEDQASRVDASTDRESLQNLVAKGSEMIPGLADSEITATYAGLRPASEFQDYQVNNWSELNYVTVGGIRSTGLSSALGIARHVSELIDTKVYSGKPIVDPAIPKADRLSHYHSRDWEEVDNGGIVCHCEWVTRREIKRVMEGPIPPSSLEGLKRRTRVCMGRCQGFYCTAELAKITNGRFDLPLSIKHE
jgi:glycerol-3-phosphate dehydrogenase